LPGSRTFSHGVATDDPTTEQVVIWTRVESDRDGVPVEWIVAAFCPRCVDPPSWRLVASPSIFMRTWCERPDELLHRAQLKLIDEGGEGPDEDQWDGYPAERTALLERLAGERRAAAFEVRRGSSRLERAHS
jgi:phosphodiesterase/alkaline phosphatase D-like protein